MSDRKDIELSIKDGAFETKTNLPGDATQQQIDAAWNGLNQAYATWASKEKNANFFGKSIFR